MNVMHINHEEIADFSQFALKLIRDENSVENVLHELCEEWSNITDCHSCAFVFINNQTEYLEIKNFKGLSWNLCKDFRNKIDIGYLGELFWRGKAIILNSPDKNAEMWDELVLEGEPNSLLVVAIENQGRTLGYFYSAFHDRDIVDDSMIDLANIAADISGEISTRDYLIHQLLKLEMKDRDVGVLRFHAFYDQFVQELERTTRYEQVLSLALFDVDNFKSIDQMYGRELSTQLLRELADFLGSHIRTVDIIGRFGVDEYIIALPQTALDYAEVFLKRLYDGLQKTFFTDKDLQITLSTGLVSFPTHARNVHDLIRGAKFAVFEAQRKGRNHFYIPDKSEGYV
ncbi:MAG: GGDEF domain-containing protein [Melioribacteraceae bacterium]|nr:GGDEF domain-containing protein [Melioribacteraceae bacterium]